MHLPGSLRSHAYAGGILVMAFNTTAGWLQYAGEPEEPDTNPQNSMICYLWGYPAFSDDILRWKSKKIWYLN